MTEGQNNMVRQSESCRKSCQAVLVKEFGR